jgi:hypothetical protein
MTIHDQLTYARRILQTMRTPHDIEAMEAIVQTLQRQVYLKEVGDEMLEDWLRKKAADLIEPQPKVNP